MSYKHFFDWNVAICENDNEFSFLIRPHGTGKMYKVAQLNNIENFILWCDSDNDFVMRLDDVPSSISKPDELREYAQKYKTRGEFGFYFAVGQLFYFISKDCDINLAAIRVVKK